MKENDGTIKRCIMKEYLSQLKHVKLKLDSKIIGYDLSKTIGIYAIATIIALIFVKVNVISDNIYGVYMLAVAITAFLTNGYLWSIISSVGGVIGVNFFFTAPYYNLDFSMAGYPVTFAILLLMSCLTSGLTGRVKKSAILAMYKERRAKMLAEMSAELLTAHEIDTILDISLRTLHDTYNCSSIIYYQSPNNPTIQKQLLLHQKDDLIFNSLLEKQVAQKAYDENVVTGIVSNHETQNCKGSYLPIATDEKKYGVLGLIIEDPDTILKDTIPFISVMVTQIILALERQLLEDKTNQILLEKEREKMRSNLLRAVSHDIRTPLTCILGATNILQNTNSELTKLEQDDLLQSITKDAEWLIQMVENLLAVTRINKDGAQVQKSQEIVEEVVGEAVLRIKKRFPNAPIQVSVPREVLLIPMDATLIEQVLINLLENAIRHSGSTKPISLTVRQKETTVLFSISDQGKGLPLHQIDDIFSGKLNAYNDSSRGLGIGLSICKTIIQAHNGTIFAENNSSGGAKFTFALPLKGDIK
ncbi:ATP-binding protein [Chakrabartyella piscis]|uniref:ATP-binding protein n=1 Tax=Chakrabartyella piscis TaxID=2918914 RepID=UPI0029585350|nr:ATP-binding protein [Chakrabartyella piscis]